MPGRRLAGRLDGMTTQPETSTNAPSAATDPAPRAVHTAGDRRRTEAAASAGNRPNPDAAAVVDIRTEPGPAHGPASGPNSTSYAPPVTDHRMRRSANEKMLAGVCSGIAEHTGIDPVYIRLVFLVSLFWGGIGIFAYLAAILVMPKPLP